MSNPAKTPGVKDLNVDTILALHKVKRPTRDEVIGMINSICNRKLWSRAKFCALLCTSADDLARFERGAVEELNWSLVRCIWLFYMLDTAPECAMSLIHIATWGKIECSLPTQRKPWLKGDEREKAIAWLKEQKPCALTIADIQAKFTVQYGTARKLCMDSGYRFANRHKKTHRPKRLPAILKPNSHWLRTDWRESDKKIAEHLGMNEKHVKWTRLKFRRLPIATLKRHLLACGITDMEEKFEPIFRKRVKVMRSNVKKVIKLPVVQNKINSLEDLSCKDSSKDSISPANEQAVHENGSSDSGDEDRPVVQS